MELVGVIVGAIITGLFSFGGIWFADYLKRRRTSSADTASGTNVAKPPEESASTPKQPVAEAKPKPMAPSTTTVGVKKWEFVFYREPLWWGILVLITGICIGGAFLANWIFQSILGIFNVELMSINSAALTLSLAGLFWGFVYIITGTISAREGTDHSDSLGSIFFGIVGPYFEIADDFLPGLFKVLLTAIPFNILVAWGAANGIAYATDFWFQANFDGVVYLSFGILTIIFFALYVSSDYTY